jgi:lysophospholipase L1-like esterase
MTTLSRTRRLTTLASASILVASATVFGALPAFAAPGGESGPPPAEKATYAALGDSYAAGFGGGEYVDACFTSPNGYAAELAADPGLAPHATLRGCTGATIEDVVANQLGGLDLRTRLITLTVGANDLGLAAVTTACLTGTVEQCAPELLGALMAIRTAAPKATVIVTGYPLLLDPALPQASAVNDGIIALNAVIEAAVEAAGPGFVYVDVTDEFADHGIGSMDPWIVLPGSFDAFHPNPEGYDAYATAIRSAR